ncbi:MAG: biotin transporter BioY [Clostridia bacterium]
MGKIATRNLVLTGMFAALIAVGAFIKIPIPYVPVTLQTLFVMLAGALLGRKFGALSAIIYVVLGLVGLPIFTQGGGFSYVFQPTFGYLIGFIFGAYVTGLIANGVENPSFWRIFLANLAGIAVIYVLGMAYFYIISNYVINSPVDLKFVMIYCFATTIVGDIVLCVLSAIVCRRLIPILGKSNKCDK